MTAASVPASDSKAKARGGLAGPLTSNTPMPAVMQKAHILSQAVCCMFVRDWQRMRAAGVPAGRYRWLQCGGQRRAGSRACRAYRLLPQVPQGAPKPAFIHA